MTLPLEGAPSGIGLVGYRNGNVKRRQLFRNPRSPISTFEACGLFKIDHFSPGNGRPRRTMAEFHALNGTQDQSRIVLFRLDMKSEKPSNNNYHDHYSDDVEDIHLSTPVRHVFQIRKHDLSTGTALVRKQVPFFTGFTHLVTASIQ